MKRRLPSFIFISNIVVYEKLAVFHNNIPEGGTERESERGDRGKNSKEGKKNWI